MNHFWHLKSHQNSITELMLSQDRAKSKETDVAFVMSPVVTVVLDFGVWLCGFQTVLLCSLTAVATWESSPRRCPKPITALQLCGPPLSASDGRPWTSPGGADQEASRQPAGSDLGRLPG